MTTITYGTEEEAIEACIKAWNRRDSCTISIVKNVTAEAITMNRGQTVRWYYEENDLLSWIKTMLSWESFLTKNFLKAKEDTQNE